MQHVCIGLYSRGAFYGIMPRTLVQHWKNSGNTQVSCHRYMTEMTLKAV